MRKLVSLLLLLSFSLPLSAEVLCPRVTSEHNADTTDLKRFRQYHRWRHKEGEALAVALWQYLCGKETGLYHMNTVNDGPDPWSEYSTVRDPIKLLNVYNVGYCGIFGPVLDGVFQGTGFEKGLATPTIVSAMPSATRSISRRSIGHGCQPGSITGATSGTRMCSSRGRRAVSM